MTNNFFKNLGIGEIALIGEWLEDFKKQLNYAQAESIKVQNKKIVMSPYCNVTDTIDKILKCDYIPNTKFVCKFPKNTCKLQLYRDSSISIQNIKNIVDMLNEYFELENMSKICVHRVAPYTAPYTGVHIIEYVDGEWILTK
jgi:hypothetical protein